MYSSFRFELEEIADKEIKKFLEKYKINKTAEIYFRYESNSDICEIVIKK